MKSINEYIAKKANWEDGVTGHFWEGRFKCVRLEDEAAILSCAMYVDLNPIRAEIAQTPEESIFTSAYERIQSIMKIEADSKEPQLWLNPIEDLNGRRGFLPLSLAEYLSLLDSTGREYSSW